MSNRRETRNKDFVTPRTRRLPSWPTFRKILIEQYPSLNLDKLPVTPDLLRKPKRGAPKKKHPDEKHLQRAIAFYEDVKVNWITAQGATSMTFRPECETRRNHLATISQQARHLIEALGCTVENFAVNRINVSGHILIDLQKIDSSWANRLTDVVKDLVALSETSSRASRLHTADKKCNCDEIDQWKKHVGWEPRPPRNSKDIFGPHFLRLLKKDWMKFSKLKASLEDRPVSIPDNASEDEVDLLDGKREVICPFCIFVAQLAKSARIPITASTIRNKMLELDRATKKLSKAKAHPAP